MEPADVNRWEPREHVLLAFAYSFSGYSDYTHGVWATDLFRPVVNTVLYPIADMIKESLQSRLSWRVNNEPLEDSESSVAL